VRREVALTREPATLSGEAGRGRHWKSTRPRRQGLGDVFDFRRRGGRDGQLGSPVVAAGQASSPPSSRGDRGGGELRVGATLLLHAATVTRAARAKQGALQVL